MLTWSDTCIAFGTLATLTGETRYERLDLIRSSFIIWAVGREFQSWQAAWKAFWITPD